MFILFKGLRSNFKVLWQQRLEFKQWSTGERVWETRRKAGLLERQENWAHTGGNINVFHAHKDFFTR